MSEAKTTRKKPATSNKKVKPKAPAKVKAAPKPKASAKVKVAPKAKTAPKAPAKVKAAPKAKAPEKRKAVRGKKATFTKQATELLLGLKKQILHEVTNKVKTESNESKFEIGDIYDIASIERERELSLILGDRDRAKLSEIEDAFDRIHDDIYDECEECGEHIAHQRLLAMPFTRVCVDCKSRHERLQKATGRFDEDIPGSIIERSGADIDD